MAFPRRINIDFNSVENIRSRRRIGLWTPTQNTVVGKVLFALVCIFTVGGIVAAIIVPITFAVTQETANGIQTTVTTATTTTATTATTTSATTSTSTTATTTTSLTTTSTTSTSSTSTTSTSTSSTTSSTKTTSTSTTTSSTSTSTTTTTSTTSSTTTTSTSTTTATTSTSTTSTTSIISCSPSSSTTLAPGGAGGASVLYTFDGNSNDYFGHYNAVPHNSPQYVSPGYNGRGNAIQILSASSQYLTITNLMNFYRQSVTVEAWLYPLAIYVSNPYTDMIIFQQIYANTQYQYMQVMLRNGKVYGSFFYDDVSGGTVLQVNQWQHIAFTYNLTAQTQLVYVNGVLDATNANATPPLLTSGTQTIGCYNTFTGGFFNGWIDQLTILFNQTKTAAQILADATLVGYYSMDCSSYNSLDSGPNQINGIAVGVTPGDGGRIGQSYLFNSTLAYFQVTALVLLGQSYRPYSFVMWIRPIVSVTSGGTILHLSRYTNGTGSCVQLIGLNSLGNIVVNGYNSSGVVSIVGPILNVGQWVHIVETYSQTNGLRLYINGGLYGQSSPFVYAASGVPMTVTLGQPLAGISCSSGGIQSGYYQGDIDEFAIYSRELSQSDITAMANP